MYPIGKLILVILTRPTLLLPSLLATVFLLASCTAPAEMPVAALEALNQQWESLPGYQGSGLDILRAWQGEPPAEAPASMEIWCVEAQPASSLNPEEQPAPFIWIVVRESQDAEWTAAMLVTMSAMWPYQACGTVP
jgi:hypothetical protein